MCTIKVYQTMSIRGKLQTVEAETIKELSFLQVTRIAKVLDRLDQQYIIKP